MKMLLNGYRKTRHRMKCYRENTSIQMQKYKTTPSLRWSRETLTSLPPVPVHEFPIWKVVWSDAESFCFMPWGGRPFLVALWVVYWSGNSIFLTECSFIIAFVTIQIWLIIILYFNHYLLLRLNSLSFTLSAYPIYYSLYHGTVNYRVYKLYYLYAPSSASWTVW